MRVVFICTGNICRSPMAEGILRYQGEKLGRSDLKVSSMGIHGLDHQQPARYAIDVCQENNIDISDHRSRSLVIPELEAADIFLSMERVQRDFIRLYMPNLDDRNFLLGAWPDKETRKSNIKDPIGCPMKTFRKVFKIISGHIERIIPML